MFNKYKKFYLTIISIITIILVIYIVLSIYITTLAIKATRKAVEENPNNYGMNFKEVKYMTSDNIDIHGWFIENKNNETIVFVHGVDSNKADGYKLELMKDIYDMGYSMLAFDLRAHGDSGGKNLGLTYHERADLIATLKYLKEIQNIEEVILYGSSYGGTLVLSNSDLTNDVQIKGIVADSPFYDLPQLVAGEVSSRTFLPESVASMLKFGIIQSINQMYGISAPKIMDRIKNINNFKNPVLLFHCIPDDRIPIKHSQDISKFLPANSEYFEFDYCDHSNAYEIEKKEFTQMLKTYFESSFN